MSPDAFDDIDRALASGLCALAPDVQGDEETLASLRPRFRRARTRARVAKIGGTVVALVVLGAVATLAAPRSTRPHVSVSSQSSVAGPTGPSVRSTTVPTTTIPAAGKATLPGRVTSPATPNATKTNASPTTIVTVPGRAPGGGPGSSGGGDGGGPGGSPTTTTVAPASEVQVFRSQGGSITVRISHGSLTLLAVSPASGYATDGTDTSSDSIDVRFRNGNDDKWRIRVQIDDQGRLVHEIDAG